MKDCNLSCAPVSLNFSHVADRGIYFNYSLSERLGRSNNKEQYVFLYR